MFKNIFVLKKLHVIMPNPLKKKMLSDIASLHFTNILKTTPPPPKIHSLKIHVDFFPGIWNMKVLLSY